MGTEVLLPHDCLRPAPALFPRRRTSPVPNPNPRHHPKPHRKRREGSPKPAKSGGELRRREAEVVRLQRPAEDPAVYAGTAFWLSPSPSSLPLPSFFRERGDGATAIDYSATRDLRRLLRLD